MSDNGNTQACADDTRPCVKGCGFYGSAQTGYMCSKCFKDTAGVTRASIENTPTPEATLSSSSSSTAAAPLAPPTLTTSMSVVMGDESASSLSSSSSAASASVSSEGPDAQLKEAVGMDTSLSSSSAASAALATTLTASGSSQKKKTRCGVCNKKVGLTGIECRCEGVYCGVHRYPSQHACAFDHKEHDRQNLAQTLTGGGQFSKMEHQL